jgi:hypothetical protein
VVLEDDEINTPSVKTAAMSVLVNTAIEPPIELNKPAGPQEAWYDIEYGGYILEDCPLPLKKDDLAPAVAEDNYPSPGSSQDATGQHSGGNTQCISEKHGADMLPQPTDEGDEHDCGEGVSELEKDMLHMLLAFKRKESLSSAYTPKSPRPHHPSCELAHLQVDQEPDQSGQNHSGLEGLRNASQFSIQPQKGTDAVPIPLGQQPREKVVDESPTRG